MLDGVNGLQIVSHSDSHSLLARRACVAMP
jgi:hypothetical protein